MAAVDLGLPTPVLAGADEEMVRLEVLSSDPVALNGAIELALALGGAATQTTDSVVTADIPRAIRWIFEGGLPGTFVQVAEPIDIRPESADGVTGDVADFGPTTSGAADRIGATAWQHAGFDGNGVTIGVIDYFDIPLYWNTAELGPRPTMGDVRCIRSGNDCSATFFDGVDGGGESHGAAVVDVLREIAPDANIVLGQAGGLLDYRNLIDWFKSQGVTIITRSLGSRYDGPGDGRGGLDELADYAVEQGMLWVNSGGNNGEDKYYREAVSTTGDWVTFGDTGSTFLEFTGTASLGGIRWANDWDTDRAERTDYDAYLLRAPTGRPTEGTVIASSTKVQAAGAPPIETIPGRFTPGDGETLYLSVKWKGGDVSGDILEVLDYGDGFTHSTQVAGSAATSIVDSTSLGVVSVGAIDPPASGAVASYSAQGPTNDGRVVPSLSAPAGYQNSVWGIFSGTSAAAPIVAATAAVLQSSGISSDPISMGELLRRSVIDRGVPGADNAFGAGEIQLPRPPGATDAPADASVSRASSSNAHAGLVPVTSRFVPLTPSRLLDSRPATAVGPQHLIGTFAAGESRDLAVTGVAGVASTGVTAVAVNLVTIAPDRPSFLQLLPTGQAEIGAYSNLNADAAGVVRANFAIVPVGDDGSITIYSSGVGDVIVDLLGYFEATHGATTAGRFVELSTPQRTLDTRSTSPIQPMQAGSRRQVPMPTGIDDDQVAALVITLTGTGATAPGWVQAFPTDQPSAVGITSNINIGTGQTVATTVIVPTGTAGISIATNFAHGGQANVIVDVIGYITSKRAAASTDGRFVTVRPNRAFDSRDSGAIADGAIVVVAGSDAAGVTVPTDASAIVWNIAIVDADRRGFARSWAANSTAPTTSSLNWSSHAETRASAAITAANDGRSQFLLDDGGANLPTPVGHLIVDIFGYFT